jgi:phosphoglycolate phosphatase
MASPLLIFDLDGTLIDTLEDIAAAVNRLLKDHGRDELPLDSVRGHIGLGTRNLIRQSFAPDPIPESAYERFVEDYSRNCLDKTRPYPGVPEGLSLLSDARKIVLSNKPSRICRIILDGLDLDRHFLAVYGGDSFEKRKPDPSVIDRILSRHEGIREGSILIGDSHVDHETARAAGLGFCGVRYGYGQGEWSRAADPDPTADTFEQVVSILRTKLGSSSGRG